MLGDHLREIRKKRGMTQDELAARLNVVRQTVSKWEKNLSVPDAEILQKISDIFDVEISVLLGGKMGEKEDKDEIVLQLSRINEQLIVRNRRFKRVLKIIGYTLLTIFLIQVILVFIGTVGYKKRTEEVHQKNINEMGIDEESLQGEKSILE